VSFSLTVFVSIFFLVFSDMVLGWNFDGDETSLIVLVVLMITVALSRFVARRKRNDKHA
jgi:hypothetical protein